MKIIHEKIEMCAKCPYRQDIIGIIRECVCQYSNYNRDIQNPLNIPHWCPLPDYEGDK